MKLKEWRKKKGMSQVECAAALEAFAREKYPESSKKLKQRTLGYWECGTLPRKFWLSLIEDFTKSHVKAGDFVGAE